MKPALTIAASLFIAVLAALATKPAAAYLLTALDIEHREETC